SKTIHSTNLAGKICLLSYLQTQWVIDSGATNHVCNNLHLFSNYKPLNRSILLPDGKRVTITHIGIVVLHDTIKLQHVLYAPKFKFNLLSLPKLCRDMACFVFFNHNGCFIQGPYLKEHPLPLGNLIDGLYHLKNEYNNLQTSKSLPMVNNVSDSSFNKAHLWHLGSGRLPLNQLRHVLSSSEAISCSDSLICQIYPAAKQSRFPFPLSSIKSTRPF
ncbi:Retrovirus-related Pol polyprotein from transposon RE1, partial [Bienertia sinuspersici]